MEPKNILNESNQEGNWGFEYFFVTAMKSVEKQLLRVSNLWLLNSPNPI